MKKARFYYPKPVEFIDGVVFPDTDNIIINPKKTYGKRYTMVSVYNDENDSIRFGVATCCPEDKFKKAIGRKIALEKADSEPFLIIDNATKEMERTGLTFSELVMKCLKRHTLFLLTSDEKYNKYFKSETRVPLRNFKELINLEDAEEAIIQDQIDNIIFAMKGDGWFCT